MKYYIGLDLGGTFVKGGIVDQNGNIIIKDKIPTGKDRTYTEIAKDMADLVLVLIEKSGLDSDSILSVGIGSPGTIDSKNGSIVYSPNIAWRNVPLCSEINKIINKPVYITNDANAAALGENFCGAGKKYPSMVFVTLGTGVGGGIVIDGNIFEGNCSAGAEIGHEVIKMGGEKCACGRRGCFEAYASATALIRQTKKAMRNHADSLLWQVCDNNIDLVNGKTVFDAIDLGDKVAARVLNKYLDYLAEGITNICNIFRPQAIVLGGGVCAQGDRLLIPLRQKVAKRIYGGTGYAPVEIVVAKLENDAGLCGAARLAMLKVTD